MLADRMSASNKSNPKKCCQNAPSEHKLSMVSMHNYDIKGN